MKKTPEEKRLAQIAATKRWLEKPGNREKHRAAVARCRKAPHAKERHKKRQLQYAANHREQERIRAAEWRKNNPEKYRQTERNKYLKRKNQILEYNRTYRIKNREKVHFWSKNRKARKRAGNGSISPSHVEILLIVQGSKCGICAIDFEITGFQIDHIIPLSKGGEHSNWNIMLLCPTCNKRKSARSVFEFLAILEGERAKR